MRFGHTPDSVLVTLSPTVYWSAVSLSSSLLRLITPVEESTENRSVRCVRRSGRGKVRSRGRGEGRGREKGEGDGRRGEERGWEEIGSTRGGVGMGGQLKAYIYHMPESSYFTLQCITTLQCLQ